jgi:hypothetical protein
VVDVSVVESPVEISSIVETPSEVAVVNSYAGGVIYAGVALYLEIVAGSAISGHRAIAVVNGVGIYADAATIAHAYLVQGVSVGAVALGGNISVANRQRVVEPSWSWIPGNPIYLGYGGQLTQSPPSPPTAKFLLQVGIAISPTEAEIDVCTPIYY